MVIKPKLNQPDVETTTTIPNITIEKEKNLELIKQLGIELTSLTPQPSKFEQCIKEWEERGWKTSYICDGINLSKLIDGIVEYFYFDKDLKRIDCNCFISFDLIPLIHKTLKALGEMKDEN